MQRAFVFIWFDCRRPPIDLPLSSLARYSWHPIPRPAVKDETRPFPVRRSYLDSLTYYNSAPFTARDSENLYVNDESHYYLSHFSQYDAGAQTPFDRTTYYNYSGPFNARNSLQCMSADAKRHDNDRAIYHNDALQRRESVYPASRHNTSENYRGPGEREQRDTPETRVHDPPALRRVHRPTRRPESQYPDDEQPTSPRRPRGSLTRRQQTLSIYPTD